LRNFLFDLTARSGAFAIWLLQGAGKCIAYVFGAICGVMVWLTANITRTLLVIIDKRKYEHSLQVTDQYALTRELEILQAVTRVKEDAMNRALWTNNHSIELNMLGSRLYNECEWSEASIHKYMRTVVESIPGLSYMVPDNESDDDEDGIPIN